MIQDDAHGTAVSRFTPILSSQSTQTPKVPADTPSPSAVLTKANVSQYYAAGSTTVKKLPPLSAQEQYLAGTGVLQKFGNVSGLS